MKNKTSMLLLIGIMMVLSMTLVSAQPYNEWVEETTLPGDYGVNGTIMAQLVEADNQLFLIGGRKDFNQPGLSFFTDTWMYDLDTKIWTRKADVLGEVTGMGVVHYDGKIYLKGQWGSTEFLIYDIVTDVWSYGAAMPDQLYDFGFVAYDGKIYAATGGIGTTAGNKTLIYDIATDSWSYGAEAPRAREGQYGSALVDGKIYVLGGSDLDWDFPLFVDIYDIATDTWTSEPIPQPEIASAYGAIGAVGPYVFIVGGWWDPNEWYESKMTWMYNTETNEWIQQSNYPFLVSEPGVTTNQNTMWIAGGHNYDFMYGELGYWNNKIYSYTLPSGCMDENAINYNGTVMIDNGSCEYAEPAPAPSRGGGGGSVVVEESRDAELEESRELPLEGALGEGLGLTTSQKFVAFAAVVVGAYLLLTPNALGGSSVKAKRGGRKNRKGGWF
jgi:hypothetical protein